MSAISVSTLLADELVLTAYHEAGHAVVAEAQWHSVYTVSIWPDELAQGWVMAAAGEASPYQQAVWAYAGQAAVVSLIGQGSMTDGSAAACGAGQDFAQAAALLDEARQESAKTEALRLVNRYRPAIERLVKLLSSHMRVDGEIVAMLVDWQDDGVDADRFIAYWTREQNDEWKPRRRRHRRRPFSLRRIRRAVSRGVLLLFALAFPVLLFLAYALFVIGHACALYGPEGIYGPPPAPPPLSN